MRIFIGYGYNERDKWIETLVIPLVEAFGCAVVHGKAVYGGNLPEEVVTAIRSSNAMIGFTTRREVMASNQFSTHPWVVQELAIAYAQDPRIPFVEVREEGVISPGGIVEGAGAQRIDYRETERAACLLQIAQALRRFREESNVTTVRLGPSAVVDQISAHLDDVTLAASCQVLRGNTVLPTRPIPIFPIKGGLFVKLRGIADGDLIRITIAARGRTWRSSYESVDAVDIQLKE